MPVGFSKACRTCLTLDGTLISIYDSISYDGKGHVIDVIKDITKITPMKSDGLPELVCQTCFNEINRCYSFKVKCLNSDYTLRKLFATEEELAEQQQVRIEDEEKECKPIVQNPIIMQGSDKVGSEQEPAQIKIKTEKDDGDAFGYFVISSVCGQNDVINRTEVEQTAEPFQAPQVYIKEEINDDEDYYNTSLTRSLTYSDICPSGQSLGFDNLSLDGTYPQVKVEFAESMESEPQEIDVSIKPSYPCPKCGREFLYTSRLKKHMRLHETKPFICSICSRSFKLSGQLRRHIDITHRNIKPFKCEECPRTFLFPSKLKEHLRSHNIRPFKCEECPRTFLFPSKLKEHLRSHNKGKNIESLYPNTVDKKEKEDQPTALTNQSKDIECTVAQDQPIVLNKQSEGIEYASENQFEKKVESKIDESTKDLNCTLEESSEEQSTVWTNAHQRLTRQSVRNRKGEMGSPESLNNEAEANCYTNDSSGIKVKTRSSEKLPLVDYSVDSHDQSFDKNNSPDGSRHYKCPHCNKDFKYLSRFNEHVACHSDVRPFDCTNCGKFFKTPGQLARHLKTSHKISSCTRRRKAYSRRRTFMRKKGFLRKKFESSNKKVDYTEETPDERNTDQQIEDIVQKDNENLQAVETNEESKEIDGKTDETNQNESQSTLSNPLNEGESDLKSKPETPEKVPQPVIAQTTKKGEKQNTNEARTYPCDQCDITFCSVSRFLQHMLGHGIDKPFVCSICSRGFKTYSNMNSHIVISHDKLKPFKCNDCHRAFSCKSNLKKHLISRIWTKSCTPDFAGRHDTKKKIQNKNLKEDLNVKDENKDSKITDEKVKQKYESLPEKIIENTKSPKKEVKQLDVVAIQETTTQTKSVKASPGVSKQDEPSNSDPAFHQLESTTRHRKPKNPLECHICKRVFTYVSYLKKHLQSHSDERPFGCLTCNKYFKYKVSLKHHNMITHAKIKPYKCDKCPQEFVNEYNYRVHRNSHNKAIHKKTKSKRAMAKLLPNLPNSSNVDNNVDLPSSTMVDKSLNKIQENDSPGTNKEEINCTICSTAIEPEKLAEHMEQYHNTPESTSTQQKDTASSSFHCSQCSKVFLFASYLKKHMKSHNDERPHVCPNCGKAFKVIWRLRSHIKEKHGSISKKFSHRKKKKNHNRDKILSTLLDRADKGDLNDRPEEASDVLNNPPTGFDKTTQPEIKTPEVVKPKCKQCNRVFQFASQLESHMRTHTGERPFRCLTCNKTFTQNGHLKNHILINHKKIMPFQCKFCSRGFASGFNMRVHMKTHTNGTSKNLEANLENNDTGAQSNDSHANVPTTSEIAEQLQENIQEQVFEDFEKLELHPLFGSMSNAEENTNYATNNFFSCTHCDETFLFRSQLNEHLETHNTTIKPFICSTCGKTFKMSAHLKIHTQMSHTKSRNFKCVECDRVFLTLYILNKHMRSHKGGTGKSSKTKTKAKHGHKKRKYNRKQTIHSEELCSTISNDHKTGKVATNDIREMANASQEEINNAVGINNTKITCALCSVSVNAANLTDHMKLCLNSAKSGDSRLKSELLPDSQPSAHPLFQTLSSNQEEQQIDNSKHCVECNRDFVTVLRYVEHMRSHSNERPFICTSCGKGFKKTANLRSHIMIVHRRILPFKCIECSRGFSSKYNLNVHLKSHIPKGNHKKGNSSKRLEIVNKSYHKDPPYNTKPIQVDNADQIATGENDKGNIALQYSKQHNTEEQIPVFEKADKIRCTVCLVSLHPDNLSKHMKESHNPPAFLTPNPDKTDFAEKSEQLHNRSLGTDPKQNETQKKDSPRCLQCPTCNKEFVHLSRLNEHMRTHSDERPFICLVCGNTFKWHSHLMTHIATCHKKDKPFKCKECPQEFSSSVDLNVHLQTHMNEPNMGLSVETGQDYLEPPQNEESIIDNRVVDNSTTEGTQQCTFCPTVFKSISQLMEHMKVHTSDRPFICSLCGKGFSNHDDLSTHLLLRHNKSKPFQCDQCIKKFRTSVGLKTHLLTHTGNPQQLRTAKRRKIKNKNHNLDPPNSQVAPGLSEEMPQCHICKKDFINIWVLRQHMKLHTNEKPFICPICGKRFHKKYNLKIHIMAHKKIKPFKCEHCSQSFCTNAGRKNHMRTHTHGSKQIKVTSFNTDNLTL